jgi:glucosamine-6-phosphate deaminase
MTVKVCKSVEEAGRCAAALFAARVISRPDCVLGLATGSSVLHTYAALIEDFEAGITDYSRVTTFNLDEYLGLKPEDENSFNFFMRRNLFSRLNVPAGNIHIPDGLAADPGACCEEYERAIEAAGGIDLQLLGIGRNGHIAFNEPGGSFGGKTRAVTLAEDTIAANSRFFKEPSDIPKRALTMGAGTIMKAKSIVLMACGKEKAAAVSGMLNGPLTPACPASILRLHPNVTVIIDEELKAALPQA